MTQADRVIPERRCNGGPNGSGGCGERATVVCTERKDGAVHPLQWYACDLEAHQEGAHTEPIASFFARLQRACEP